jgi:hypothetical protein
MFCASDFLSSAVSNLRRLTEAQSVESMSLFGLAIVDAEDDNGFGRLCDGVSRSRDIDSDETEWTLYETEETTSARFERDSSVVVALRGRQIRTAENLEVLAIGTDADLEDGLSIRETLDELAEVEAVPIIPWGFGKWFGRRGRILNNLLEESEPTDFFLGDNSNRPIGTTRPALFARAETRGFRILPGSDPLPFPREHRSVGRAAFTLPGRLDLSKPASDLKLRLSEHPTTIQSFVRRESPLRFLHNQLMMQWTRRARRSEK